MKAHYVLCKILSNGKYMSVIHHVVVNNKATRISLAIANRPLLDMVVTPAPMLINPESHPPAYVGMKYEEYLKLQQSNKLDGITCLDRVRVWTVWSRPLSWRCIPNKSLSLWLAIVSSIYMYVLLCHAKFLIVWKLK